MAFVNESEIEMSLLASTATSLDRGEGDIVLNLIRTLNLLLTLGQLPSFILYLLYLIVIVRYRKELASSFYDMSVCVGVADLAYAVFSTILMILFITAPTALQQLPSAAKKLVAYLFLLALNGATIAQYTGILMLSINRFTALVFPLRYTQIWSGKYDLAVVVILQWLPSLLPVFLYRLIPTEPGEFAGILNLGFVLEPESRRRSHLWDAVHLAVTALFVILLYAVMFVVMLRRRLKQQRQVTASQSGAIRAWGSTTSKAKMRRETKLALIGLILAACTVYLAVFHAIAYTHVTGDPLLSAGAYAVLAEAGRGAHTIFTFLNPYLVLAVSSSFRGHFRQFLRCG